VSVDRSPDEDLPYAVELADRRIVPSSATGERFGFGVVHARPAAGATCVHEGQLPVQPQLPDDEDDSLRVGIFRTARNRLELCALDDKARQEMSSLRRARKAMQLLKYSSRSRGQKK
jgi:hypothetical protein